MIATGLLWYDDDTHHSLAQKLAEAAERYRERLGFEPTTCQLNPALIPAAPPIADAGKPARRVRARASEPAIALRLVANEHLRPNYFFVGVEDGESIARIPGWRDEMSDEDRETKPDHATRRSSKVARPAKKATVPTAKSTAKSSEAHKAAESATDTSSPASAPRPRRGIAAKVAPTHPAATPTPVTEVQTPVSRQRRSAKSEKPAESATGGTVKTKPTGTQARKAAESATAVVLPSPRRRGSARKLRVPAETQRAKREGGIACSQEKGGLGAGGAVLIPAESATTSERGKRASTVSVPDLRQSSSRGRSSEQTTATRRGRKAAESATTVPTHATAKVAIPEPASAPASIAAPRKRGKNGNMVAAAPTVIPAATPASRRTPHAVSSASSMTAPTTKRRSPAPISRGLPAQPSGPIPAQAPLWSDAPAPVRPAHKRRSA